MNESHRRNAICRPPSSLCVAGLDYGEVDSWMMPFSSSCMNSTIAAANFSLSISITLFNTASSAAPQISVCQRIEPRTVETLTLPLRRSNHSATSHAPDGYISSSEAHYSTTINMIMYRIVKDSVLHTTIYFFSTSEYGYMIYFLSFLNVYDGVISILNVVNKF